MLRTIFGKTLFEKRWSILIWFGAIFASTFGLCMLFPALRDTMGTMMGSVPESMQGFFGEATTWTVFNNYAAQEVFGEWAFLPAVMAIVFAITIFASEEISGRMLAVLSRPVGRLSYYFQKWLVVLTAAFIGTLALFVGAIVSGPILGESMSIGGFAIAAFMTFLHALALGTITMAISAAFAKKNIAGVIVGFYAFLSFFIVSMSTAAEIVEKISDFALYNYIDAHGVIANGLSGKNLLILGLAILVPLVIAAPIFRRRDLRTR